MAKNHCVEQTVIGPETAPTNVMTGDQNALSCT
jgi:hypothetical protein